MADILTCLKQRGFLLLPITSMGNRWLSVELAHAKAVIRSLLILGPGAANSRRKARVFRGKAFQLRPVLSAL